MFKFLVLPQCGCAEVLALCLLLSQCDVLIVVPVSVFFSCLGVIGGFGPQITQIMNHMDICHVDKIAKDEKKHSQKIMSNDMVDQEEPEPQWTPSSCRSIAGGFFLQKILRWALPAKVSTMTHEWCARKTRQNPVGWKENIWPGPSKSWILIWQTPLFCWLRPCHLSSFVVQCSKCASCATHPWPTSRRAPANHRPCPHYGWDFPKIIRQIPERAQKRMETH